LPFSCNAGWASFINLPENGTHHPFEQVFPVSVQSYCFKASSNYPLQEGFKRFLRLAGEAADLLLGDLWSGAWIDRLGASRLKAYKVIGEKHVVLEKDGTPVYFPSRIRRGVAEQVGRVLRSQSERKNCFAGVSR
jgi:hypothetical protein